MTLVAWGKEQKSVQKVTCFNTLAESYFSRTSVTTVAVAERACKGKHDKCNVIKSSYYVFRALAFKNVGPWAGEFLKILLQNRNSFDEGIWRAPRKGFLVPETVTHN